MTFDPGGFAGLGALWRGQSPVMRRVVMMCLSTVAFAVMHLSVRVVSAELHPFQIAFFRNLFGLAFLVPLLIGPGFAQMQTEIGLLQISKQSPGPSVSDRDTVDLHDGCQTFDAVPLKNLVDHGSAGSYPILRGRSVGESSG